MNNPVIDQTVFTELQAAAGADFVVELVDAFLEEAPTLLAELKSAKETADAASFQRAAHSLKSNGNTFGAPRFAALARELEFEGLDCETDKLTQLQALFDEAASALKALCDG